MLEVKSLSCGYGAVVAVDGVSLHVSEGELVCILGSNGAGKSTLMKGISGLLKPSGGSVTFDGHDLTGRPPSEAVDAGVVMVAEGRRIFRGMSVDDNLDLGGYPRRKDVSGLATSRKEVLDLFPILGAKGSEMAGSLSGGQQQMLAMAQALMAAPRLLILDEPSLGLAPSIVADVFGVISRLRDGGMAMILVEQMVGRALAISDRGYVLQTGHLVAEGTADKLRADDSVRAAYLGAS